MYRNSKNVEYEMIHHTNNYWGHWNSGNETKGLKKCCETIPEEHSINSLSTYIHTHKQTHTHARTHEGRSQSSWIHLITPSRNFVEMRWRSLFRSTSLGKWCTSYNAPPTSRKRAADRWSLQNFSPRSSLVMVRKAQNLISEYCQVIKITIKITIK
jgi:hypothetical protein